MFGLVVEWDSPTVHLVSGGDVSVESTFESRTLGPIVDGCVGGGTTLCGKTFHGVMGLPSDASAVLESACEACGAVSVAQRRSVVPDGWTHDEHLAYWRGFDHGREYAGFMAGHPVSEFGYTPMSVPDYIHRNDVLRGRFDEGAEDGVRSSVIDGWAPRW